MLYQVMTNKDKKGRYIPNYPLLLEHANSDEKRYIEGIMKRCPSFAYNMIYIAKQSCGHYEIFQTPQNENYPLDEIIEVAEDCRIKMECTRCICGF